MTALTSAVRPRVGWRLALYPDAFEASGSLITSRPRTAGVGAAWPSEAGADEIALRRERAASEAARRARRQLRRYVVANRLTRLTTMTYAGEGCHDPRAVRRDVAAFFVALRSALGPLPYAWCSELHPGGHGWHVHAVLDRYVPRRVVEAAWGHGFVHIRRITDLPVGSGVAHEAAIAGRYIAKTLTAGYLSKDFTARGGLHRYEVAQGFQPRARVVWGRTARETLTEAAGLIGADPTRVWRSIDADGWQGPPAVWASWL